MKLSMKTLACFFVIFFICSGISSAADLESPGTPMRKLQRGFLNIALAPMDLFAVLEEGKKENDIVPGWASGLFKGTIFSAGRAVTGVYEMVTFFIPAPSGYEPIIQPEFAWQHFDEETKN